MWKVLNELRQEIRSIRQESRVAIHGPQVQEGVVVGRSELRPGIKQFKAIHKPDPIRPAFNEKLERELDLLQSKMDQWIEQQYAKSATFRVVSIVPSETVLSPDYLVLTLVVHYLC